MSLVGAYVALSKPLALVFPVFLLAWLRFGIGVLAMLRWLAKPATEAPMAGRTKLLVCLGSFLGNFLFTICMLYGVRLTGAVPASVIMAAIPAVVAVMSWGFLRERVGMRVWAAVACGALGIVLLSLAQASSAPAGDPAVATAWLGNALIFAAVLCEASYVVIGKKLTALLAPKRISAIINLWGFALMTPMGIYFALDFDFTAVAMSVWLLLLFYAMAASVWTVWLWMTGLKSVPAARAGVFTVMLPISAALVGTLALGESFTGLQAGAFSLAIAGLVLATLPERRPATTPTGTKD